MIFTSGPVYPNAQGVLVPSADEQQSSLPVAPSAVPIFVKTLGSLYGVSGNILYSMPEQGAAKKLTCYFNGYVNSASATLTFQTPFLYTPIVSANTTGLVLAPSARSFVIPVTNTPVTGVLIIEGI